jgi:hypothetical protein
VHLDVGFSKSFSLRSQNRQAASSIATINEFHNFKKAYGTQTGANVGECRTSLRDRLVGVWTGAAFDEPIEELWSGRVRSGGPCLHPHR